VFAALCSCPMRGRLAVCAAVLTALGLSSCSDDKPPTSLPSIATTASPTPTPAATPSPTASETPEQAIRRVGGGCTRSSSVRMRHSTKASSSERARLNARAAKANRDPRVLPEATPADSRKPFCRQRVKGGRCRPRPKGAVQVTMRYSGGRVVDADGNQLALFPPFQFGNRLKSFEETVSGLSAKFWTCDDCPPCARASVGRDRLGRLAQRCDC
jgi:hypothetical protein